MLQVFLLTLCAMVLLPTVAYADVAIGPTDYMLLLGVPVLVFAVLVLVLVLLARLIAALVRHIRDKREP